MIGGRLAGVLTVIIILGPNPVYPQCEDITFARSNPGLCFPGPMGPIPPLGGGGGGGILGTIGRVLHGLTGGIL